MKIHILMYLSFLCKNIHSFPTVPACLKFLFLKNNPPVSDALIFCTSFFCKQGEPVHSHKDILPLLHSGCKRLQSVTDNILPLFHLSCTPLSYRYFSRKVPLAKGRKQSACSYKVARILAS